MFSNQELPKRWGQTIRNPLKNTTSRKLEVFLENLDDQLQILVNTAHHYIKCTEKIHLECKIDIHQPNLTKGEIEKVN